MVRDIIVKFRRVGICQKSFLRTLDYPYHEKLFDSKLSYALPVPSGNKFSTPGLNGAKTIQTFTFEGSTKFVVFSTVGAIHK